MNSTLKPPRVLLSRRAFFSCGRRLVHPDWGETENRAVFGRDFGPHGHEYTLDVAYDGPISATDGMIVNITELKPVIQIAVDELSGRFLNEEVEFFKLNRPTAENIALYLWQTLPHSTGPGHLVRLRLGESQRVNVEIAPESMKISRSYEFAAAHRLYAPLLSEAENLDRFEKCSNPAGHGHNFNLVVYVEGEPDPATGYIIPPQLLDALVNEEIYERFDHKHLNVDCPEFQDIIPTSENLAKVIFQILRDRLDDKGFKLSKIGLHETQKNYFEVEA